MSIFFMGGALGSALAGYLYVHGGWNYITNAGIIVPGMVFIYFLGEYRNDRFPPKIEGKNMSK